MKFYTGRVVYPNLSYDQKNQMEAACREENENGWGVRFPGCYIVVVKVTYTHISIACAIKGLHTGESDIRKKIAVMAAAIGEKSSLSDRMDFRDMFDHTEKEEGSQGGRFTAEKEEDFQEGKLAAEDEKVPEKGEWKQPIRLKEVTLNTFMAAFEDYSLENLISDSTALLEEIGLEPDKKYVREYLLGVEYWEKKSRMFENGFLEEEEKKRISKGKKFSRPMIQPVHYVIYEEDPGILKAMVQELLYHLCRKGRILNRRLVKVEAADLLDIVMGREIRNLNHLDGGCVVVYIKGDDSRKVIGDLLSCVCGNKNHYDRKYTVIAILPGKWRDKKLLKEFVPNWVFYQVCNQCMTEKEAGEYFQGLIQRDRLDGNCGGWKELFREKTQYSYGEVIAQYEYWLKNIYYIDNYFPQYKNIIREYTEEKPMTKTAREELRELIGLTEVKNLITDILYFFQLQKIREQAGGMVSKPTMHMVFYGNPGTAKTTVARLVGRILKEENIIEKGDFYEVGRANLVGKYVGWTARIVEDYFERAKGSVLFIDEAYALADEQKSFGDEAINTLVQEMEKHREDVVVIMAGYRKNMEYLLQKNQGLQSRIAFQVAFPDYSIDELYQILEQMVKAEGLKFAEDVWDPFCDRVIQVDIHQGNGRAVRNILDRAKIRQARRVLNLPEQKQREEMFLLRKEDFGEPK